VDDPKESLPYNIYTMAEYEVALRKPDGVLYGALLLLCFEYG